MSPRLATALALLLCLVAVALAEPRVKAHRGLETAEEGSLKHPYLFLTVPRGRSGGAVVRGFQLVEEDDEDDVAESGKQLNGAVDEEDDDEDEVMQDDDEDEDALDDDMDDDEEGANKMDMQTVLKQAQPTNMMVSREHAGAIMVPDGFIEIEGQSVVNPKTGERALLVPRSSLDAVPDGSVVALMEPTEALARAAAAASDEERANRVIVRRRRKGARRNVRRRGPSRRGGNRRRRGGNKRRQNTRRRPNVRVVKTGNRRRNSNRRGGQRRPVMVQG